MELTQRLLAELPDRLETSEAAADSLGGRGGGEGGASLAARRRLQDRAKAASPLQVVLAHELQRFNHLLAVVGASLTELRAALQARGHAFALARGGGARARMGMRGRGVDGCEPPTSRTERPWLSPICSAGPRAYVHQPRADPGRHHQRRHSLSMACGRLPVASAARRVGARPLCARRLCAQLAASRPTVCRARPAPWTGRADPCRVVCRLTPVAPSCALHTGRASSYPRSSFRRASSPECSRCMRASTA